MPMIMKSLDYRNLAAEELAVRLEEARREHAAAADRVAQGREKNSAKLKGLRRDIARIETILHQKQRST